jgi:hypothetical protein
MQRPGIMAPPSLYDEQPAPGLMSMDAALPPLDLSLSALLWSVATVLAAVELSIQLTL